MKSIFKRFDFRTILAIVLTISCVVIVSDFLIFRFTYQAQLEGMRNQLKAIAQTATFFIDAERLEAVPLNKDGVHTPSYDYVDDQLKKIRAANPQIKYIYTLKKVDSSNIWRFIVDAETERAEDHSDPGDVYDAGRFPEMLRGYNEPSADKKIEADKFGATLSGYAPIRDALGQPVAIVGVDVDASSVYAIYNHVLRVALFILLAGIIFAIILGVLISSRVVGPVNQLIVGTRYIADGNLHHRVQVRGDDEISELAGSFNNMVQSLEESRRKLLDYFYDTVKSLVLILEYKDQFTLGHSQSVANYAEKIAQRMGVDPKTVDMFKKVTLLHDIGKLGVRDNVLLKPDKLNEEEWENIKAHPVLGEQILKPILSDPLMLAVIRNHHERQDGKGYPDALSRGEIPLLVAIVTVADSYDAMTANRPYRNAMSQAQAIEQLQKGRGSQFHPDVVDVFLEILNERNHKEA
jgi:putative nucleotidyltransferase with HDIG domain